MQATVNSSTCTSVISTSEEYSCGLTLAGKWQAAGRRQAVSDADGVVGHREPQVTVPLADGEQW